MPWYYKVSVCTHSCVCVWYILNTNKKGSCVKSVLKIPQDWLIKVTVMWWVTKLWRSPVAWWAHCSLRFINIEEIEHVKSDQSQFGGCCKGKLSDFDVKISSKRRIGDVKGNQWQKYFHLSNSSEASPADQQLCGSF